MYFLNQSLVGGMGLISDRPFYSCDWGWDQGALRHIHGYMAERWRIPEQNEVYIKKEEAGNVYRVGNSVSTTPNT